MSGLKSIVWKTFGRLGGHELVSAVALGKAFCVGYHSITSLRNRSELKSDLYSNLSINEADFDAHLSYLKAHGHTFVTMSGLRGALKHGVPKPTAIYFDDGYRDNLLNALPVLKRHGATATVFVATGLIERTSFLWTIAIRSLYAGIGRGTEEAEVKIKELKDLPSHESLTKTKDEYEAAGVTLNPKDFDMFMSWQEIGELAAAGLEIGSHTISHVDLAKVSVDKAKSELEESKRTIEERTGIPVASLSYPYGRVSDAVKSAAREAGYDCGVCGLQGWNTLDAFERDPYGLVKIAPRPGEGIVEFAGRLYTIPFARSL